jgi:hypothetical protein
VADINGLLTAVEARRLFAEIVQGGQLLSRGQTWKTALLPR